MFIANWKMNGSRSMLADWLEGVGRTLDRTLQRQCLLCPPACFLSEASDLIIKSDLNISLGAQNIDPSSFSSLTGGINGAMLRSIGSELSLVSDEFACFGFRARSGVDGFPLSKEGRCRLPAVPCQCLWHGPF